ncbi:uncharacterized protein LOC117577701 [Drosophila albomicans]|uniref:Uncharacterized protein LOC117577701 n=1 Tax=Drosophila albomicans TaxID=7291 RepID=A0A6P8XPE7_DROAB|nr:uncharacterized protein LOC117577701 [Drosophila albomicans]
MHSLPVIRQLLALCCLFVAWRCGNASNPLEQIALGALSVSEQLMNTMQDGNKVTKEFNVDTPLIKWHSKTDLGHGDAMRNAGDDSDSDESDERRRRRRRKRSHHDHLVSPHRGKRSPCFKMMTAATTESADDVEARRRAAAQRKRAANNASRSRIIRRISKNKKKKLHRSRRQLEDFAEQQTPQQQQRPSLGERFRGLWLSLVDNVVDAMQQVRDRLKNAAAQAQAQGGN